MSIAIGVHAILAGLLTWASAAKVFVGGLAHKLWSKFLGAEAKAKAELKKLEAEAAAEVKKIETKL